MENRLRRKMRILLAEPDATVQARFRSVFKQDIHVGGRPKGFEYDLIVVDHGQAAIEMVQKIFPDLVVLSNNLSSPSGKDVCRFIRENEAERHTGIVFVGHGDQSDDHSVECLEIGADDYLRSSITDREFVARMEAVLRLKAMTDELRSANHRLKLLSNTDELTGLHNMRSFSKHYAMAVHDCRSGESALGVIMLDLDRFKSVNDTSNHLIGSFVIGEVGKLLRGGGVLTETDCAARYGGDEYIIFTRDADLEAVVAKGNAISELVRKAVFMRDGRTIRITASIGVAWVAPGYTGKDEDPIKAADIQLYRSKNEGRDRVSSMILTSDMVLDGEDRIEVSDSVDQQADGEGGEELFRILNG